MRRVALLACGAVLVAAAAQVRAARLGVPSGPSTVPGGWFALVGSDAVDPARFQALGDFAHRLVLYIEVPDVGLRVELYDPGVFNPAGSTSQLDVNVDATPPLQPGQIRYVLQDPMGVVVANQTFGVDTPATEQQSLAFFDDRRAVPGIYQLEVRLLDTVGEDQDVAVFGVSVPGRQVFTYNFTGGQVNQGGATIAEPLGVFPWLVAGSAGSDALGPTCGATFISYDLDANLDGMGDPVPPPSTDVVTRRGYPFPAGEFPPSGDARWTPTAMKGLPYGLLDSNDQGVWRWEFSDLTVPEDAFNFVDPPFDLNVFSVQVLDLGAAPRDQFNWPSVPPFADANPRRIYLPEDDGSAPERPWLGHSAQVISGFPVLADGQRSTLDVTIEVGNPTSHDLADLIGESHVTPDTQVSDPVLVATTGGLVATVTGRRIDFSGDVPAGTVATVTYTVDVAPTALGREFLTGDDASFISAGAPTIARYSAAYTPSLGFPGEVLGPACDIEYESVVPSCTAVAVLTAERTRACPGTDVRLDALASQVVNCPGGVAMYQWRANGAVVHAFPAADTIIVTPFLNDTWTLEVACSIDRDDCIDSDEVTFDLYPAVAVTVTSDVALSCPGDPVRLDAVVTDGTPPYSNGRWSSDPAGAPGDGSTMASLVVNPTTTTVYTWRIDDALGCSGSDDVRIGVGTPSPQIAPVPIALCPGDSVDVSVDDSFTTYLWTTSPTDPAVEGATTPGVTVSRAGTTYTVTVTDAIGCTGVDAVMPTASPDPVPGAVGPTLRVSKSDPDVLLQWQDIAALASGYEVVFLECPTRDWRASCSGRVPDAATVAAGGVVGPVAPGAQAVAHVNAVALGDMLFYYVRALSPCSATPGPVN